MFQFLTHVTIGGKFRPLLDIPDRDVGTEDLSEDIKTLINSTSKELLGDKKPQQQKIWLSKEVAY